MSRDPSHFLNDILEAVEAIEAYVKGYAQDDFMNDGKTVDAVIRRLEVIGEASKHLPEDWKAMEPGIPWTAIAGFRNILAHAYFKVEQETVWETVRRDLPGLAASCRRLKQNTA